MNLQTVLLFSFVAVAVGKFTCSDGDCHECNGDTCHLTCQGDDCNNCPNGNCCNGDNCNVCISSICCTTDTCNECVKRNREICNQWAFPETCESTIAQKCKLQHFDNKTFGNNNYNGRLPNITTIIRIRNLINNTQVIDAPIRINLTNAYDTTVNNNNTGNAYNITGNSYIKRRKKCCSIVHPQECHKIANIPDQICFTRKHIECSDLCGNITNYLITSDSKEFKCIVIAAHPHYYCGYYALEDCSACYHCNGKSKIECLEDSACSNKCRSSIIPKKFYNVPYYIKTPGGSQTVKETELPPSQR